jgi:uncharacterized protein (TIGR01319 family)
LELSLFVDFGSTYTKVMVIDLEDESVMAAIVTPTTVTTDITEGLTRALELINTQLGFEPDYKHRVACSSAAGGLKMVAIGLVHELTAEAAKQASLGAGARVMDVFSYELTSEEIKKIDDLHPDMILLAGGTDGGNKTVLVHNAGMLGTLREKVPVIIAGNKVVAPQAAEILKNRGFEAFVVENVLPGLGKLNVEPARQKIREIFLKRIIEAKGLKKAEKLLDGILMPTPAAVLAAAQLLSQGVGTYAGWGDLLVVDPGGATTDVHSIGSGAPTKSGVIWKGLPEPEVKRTVEGDLGMRCSAQALFETGTEYLNSYGSCNTCDLQNYVASLDRQTDFLPHSQEEKDYDILLGMAAVEIAVERHAGHIEHIYTPVGLSIVQYGKDLQNIQHVIGTGGILVHSADPARILERTIMDPQKGYILKPKAPGLWLDKQYLMSALGMLGELDAEKAFRMLDKYMVRLGRNNLGRTEEPKMD